MEYTIVGAGAIGGTLGAYMARGGERVRLVDTDRDHVEAMRGQGLTIRGFDETFTVPVSSCTPEDLRDPLEVVLLAVKAQHTAEAVRSIHHLLTEQSYIVSVQNGLCERIIAELVGPERTVGCFVNFSADYLEPGVISYGGSGALHLGELDGRLSQRLADTQRAMSHWGHVALTQNLWGYLWGKLGYANMLFATALADETMADVIDRYRALMVDLAVEIYEVADREHVRVEPFDSVEPSLYYPVHSRDAALVEESLDQLVARRRRDGKSKSGIWRDLAVRKRPTEVDQQIGLAAEIGAGHGLAMPLTRRLVAMIHELEQQSRKMAWSNLDELDAVRLASARATTAVND